MIEERISLLEEILGERKSELGGDYAGYKNHVYRMIHFCFAQRHFGAEERRKIVIAGCFHDLGIWTAGTFDYLPPSIDLAKTYLDRHGLNEWSDEIATMIDLHHRIRRYPGGGHALVEVFRRGDLVDFSLGIVKCGVPAAYVREVREHFPNAGFHKRLAARAARWICRHPLNPIPVLKW